MRKLLFLLVFVAIAVGTTWADNQKIGLETSNSDQSLTVIDRSLTEITLHNSISTITVNNVETRGGNFIELQTKGYFKNTEVGAPQLPMINKLVEIPQGAEMRVVVLDYDEEVIDLNQYGFNQQVLPVQTSVFKNQDPEDVPFEKNTGIYSSSSIYGKDVVSIEYVGESRGVQIGRLRLSPFSYNPETNELIIKNNLIVKIQFVNADLQLTKSKKQQYYSPAFSSGFSNLLTVEQAPTRDPIVDYGPVKYIIVADRMFETALDPFVEWKTQKGFNVIEAYTDDIGTTTASIKTYLQDQYENPTDGVAPSYVLFVGDIAQIPAWNSQNSGGDTDHITDLYYCEYTNDNIPELYYGRFSANSVAELTPQISKTIEYERYEMADPSYLDDVVLVAGVDSYWAPSHGNGQIHYGLDHYFNASHGFDDIHTYLYGSGSPITSDQTTASGAIQQNVSDGAGFVNYTAHCDWNGWADPSFDVDDIDDLTNDGKYCLMIGNCCLSNKFNTPNNGGTCFGEKIMRAANAGVIGYIGGSNSTLWDEDFYWGVGVNQIDITSANAQSHTYANTGLGAYDVTFHENGEDQNDWFVTSGQMMYAGNMSVTAGGTSNVLYYWEIYHLMGDPSVMAYFTVPTVITATHQSSQPLGISSFTVNTDAPGAYVAISKDGVLLDAQLADASGNITLSFTAITTMGSVDVVATKQNRAPYIGTFTMVIGTEPPVADFTADNTIIWEGETVNFTDLSSQAPNAWAWNFGDGNTTAIQNPSNTYMSQGTYTVSLAASNSNGTSPTEIKTNYITVNAITDAPNVDFVADQTVVNASEEINFTDLSTNQATSWAWEFGDGFVSSDQNPVHSYTASGTYTVSLTAMNIIGGNTETKVDYIEVVVEDYCDASSTGTTYENITNVTFGDIDNDSDSDGYTDYTGMSTDVTMGIEYPFSVSYDRTYSSDEVLVWIDWNANHVFDDSEKYLVASGSGSNSPYSYNITIPTDAVVGPTRMRVRLHDTSAGPNDLPCGDSSWGEVEDYTVNIISNLTAPVAEFTASAIEVCAGTTINFSDISTNNPSSLVWHFGDGSVSSQPNPTHAYVSDGVYTVELTASNSGGSDVYTIQITVNPQPIAAYTYSQDLSEVTFSNSTSNATTYSWDFGDGNTSTDENPVHDFVNNGTYTVVFTATGSCGEDTYSEDVEITGVTVLSLNEQELSIYPNPANDFVIINTQLNRYTYRMVSMDGRVLIENQVFGEGNARIDLDNISPGMYQLIINSDAQEIIHKLVKQ